jgi:hypothetical protein
VLWALLVLAGSLLVNLSLLAKRCIFLKRKKVIARLLLGARISFTG